MLVSPADVRAAYVSGLARANGKAAAATEWLPVAIGPNKI
jgi:hypothetical protein